MEGKRSGMLKPRDVLREALCAQNNAELLVAWFIDIEGTALVFAFGDGASVTMPLAWLPQVIAQQVRGGLDPELADFGQTIRFGTYEVANRALIEGDEVSVFPRHPGSATEIIEACHRYVAEGAQ